MEQQVRSMPGFRRTVGVFELIFIGVGGIIGSGVFVLSGRAAALHAGPAVVLSFLLGGVAALFAASCYAQAAAMLPSAGGAYAYVRSAMGEVVGWIIGWDLLLEYFIGNAVVAVGWSAYAVSFLQHVLHLQIDSRWCAAPLRWDDATGTLQATGAIVNAPAALALLLVTALLRLGLRETARANALLVTLKLGVVFLFIGLAAPYVRATHFSPFVPANTGTLGHFGWSGVVQGAGMVFFSYVGFDALVTAGQEVHRPRRNLPLSIFLSLAICTLVYALTSWVLTGLVPYQQLNISNPVSFAARYAGLHWLASAIDIGALAGLTSSIAMGVMAQPRIVYSMARDGLLPQSLAKIDPKHNAPVLATSICGCGCSLIAGIIPIELLNEVVSVGVLFGFASVSLAVIVMRHKRNKRFTPIPLLSFAICLGLMVAGGWRPMLRVLAWLCLGLVILGARKRFGAHAAPVPQHMPDCSTASTSG